MIDPWPGNVKTNVQGNIHLVPSSKFWCLSGTFTLQIEYRRNENEHVMSYSCKGLIW